MYLDGRHVFSYNGYNIIILAGGRGIGKTYLAKKYVLKKYFYKGDKFIWIRATESMCDKLKDNNGRALFNDIIQNKFFKFNWDGRITGDNVIEICKHPDDEKPQYEYAGNLMALSTFYKLKGNSFADIKTIVLDEFIGEEGEVIRGDRALQFVNTIETIGRLRKDFRVILLCNALNLGDPILNLFFTNVKEHGYYFNKQKGAILYYIPDNEEFNEKRFDSISGKILKGTPYEDVIAHNKFLTYDSMYFNKLPKDSKYFCTLEIGVYKLNIYINDMLYVTDYNGITTSRLYCNDIAVKSEYANVIPQHILERFIQLYNFNKVKFSNETIRTRFIDFIS